MTKPMETLAAAAAVAAAILVLGAAAGQAQQAPLKITLFGQPSVNNDAIWMAIENGFYREPASTSTIGCSRRAPPRCRRSRPARATSS